MDVICLELNQLNIGKKAIILDVLKSDLKRRFSELGILKGNLIECIYESPFRNPRAYLVNGTFISIRNEDAASIKVEVI